MPKPEEQQLSILQQGAFQFYTVTEHGMTFIENTPRDVWLEAMKKLLDMHQGAIMTAERTLMLLADALNYGEKEWPHEFSQAIDGTREALGLSPKTVANAQWVYGKIDASRRRDGLTLGHYSVLAALPTDEQDLLMSTAIDEHMTVSRLKEHVAEVHPKTKRGKDRKTKSKETSGDDANSILQKLIDSASWFSENAPTEKMKAPLSKLHLAFRRKWQTGVRKK